ncbi:hypothetical protein M9435_003735 [Picochlorum sp. BPE23]|nr:hypothetical protein M9435_003735 [Picochlorum sp. BPE23]
MAWGLSDIAFTGNTQHMQLDPIIIDGMAVFDIAMLVVVVVGLVVAYGSRFEIVKAGPRIVRMVLWGIRSAYRYKRFTLYYTWKYSSHPSFQEMYQDAMSKMHRQVAHGLLRVCQKNGGVYVKAGQTAASLTTLPPEYREMLEKLEDSVPPRPFVAIKKALEVELGHKVEEVFEAFESKATAAASLAQVHKARLKDGTDVAVKIQYPGLESALHADLAAMTLLAGFATLVFRVSDWRWFLKEIRDKLSEELDFRNEADNAARLAICFADRDDIVVPRLFPRWSSKRLLCMEWIQGIKVSDKEELKKAGLSPRQVALLFQGVAAEMMCSHGFVHGDMHPGNVFVRALPPSSNILTPWRRHPRPQLVLIDHGLYFNLPSDMRLLYCMMWCAFVLNDAATATTAAIQLAGETTGRVLPAMLKPRDWDTMTPEERLKARNKVGFGGMQDIRNAMKSCPQDLADCLRAMTIVRHTCSRLGTNIADRLRVNAVEALKGLKVKTQSNKRVEYVGVMKSRMKRWRLWLHIAAMKLAAWIVLIAGGIHHEDENVLEQPQSDDDATSSSTKDPATQKTFHIQVMPA